jgi:predicted RNA binding protein YcfA (HicA-like mRNA interferase family)
VGKTFTSRAILKVLEKNGWQVVLIRGSHHQLKHPVKPGRVTVPHPKKDILIKTAKSIADQSGLKLSDF